MFYVSSLNARPNLSDERIIEVHTAEFSPQVWKHAIFVLSFADQHYDKPHYVQYTNEIAELFQKLIRNQNGCKNLTVECIHSRATAVPETYDIAAIPIGLNEDSPPNDWFPNLLIEAFTKCDYHGAISLLITMSSVLPTVAVSSATCALIGGTGASLAGGSTTTATVAAVPQFLLASPNLATVLNAAASAGLLPSITTTAVTSAAASTVVLGIGTGAIVGIGIGWAFKRHLWPIIREKLGSDVDPPP